MHQDLSPAMAAVRSPDGRLTLGLMTPPPQPQGSMADPAQARELAQLAEAQGIAALWTRDVPLAIPQGQDRLASSLDDPFQWLSMLAGATRSSIGAPSPSRGPIASNGWSCRRSSGSCHQSANSVHSASTCASMPKIEENWAC